MLMLSKLNSILSRVLSFPDLHTAVLLTTSGELVSYSSEPLRPKDEIRIVVGLSGEVWQETRDQGFGMVESDKIGRILVVPIDDEHVAVDGPNGTTEEIDGYSDERQPLMLLALNATEDVDWDELQEKGTVLASHLAKSLSRFRQYLKVKTIAPTPPALSPAPART